MAASARLQGQARTAGAQVLPLLPAEPPSPSALASGPRMMPQQFPPLHDKFLAYMARGGGGGRIARTGSIGGRSLDWLIGSLQSRRGCDVIVRVRLGILALAPQASLVPHAHCCSA